MQEFDPEEEAITGINVTPLVDITLVLLIIFMVTARFISEPSIGVDLPKSSSGTGAATMDDRNVFLTINEQNEIFLNHAPVRKEELSEKIRALIAEKPELNLILRADQSVLHGEVMSLLDQVRKEGVTQFGIAVEGKME